jgi:hypothetical protein
MTEHSPLPLVRLWATTSRDGMPYMHGSVGMAKVILLPVHGIQSDGHTHELCIITSSDAARQAAAKGVSSTGEQPQTDVRPPEKASIDYDDIPF